LIGKNILQDFGLSYASDFPIEILKGSTTGFPGDPLWIRHVSLSGKPVGAFAALLE